MRFFCFLFARLARLFAAAANRNYVTSADSLRLPAGGTTREARHFGGHASSARITPLYRQCSPV
jgi:hypothetical protein